MVTEMVMSKEILRDEQDDLKEKAEQEKCSNNMRCNRLPHLQRNTESNEYL